MNTYSAVKRTASTKTHKLAVISASLILMNALLAQPVSVSAASTAQPSKWAQQEVDQAYSMGLIPYHLASQYQNKLTRGELCQVIVRLYERLTGEQASAAVSNPFKDTKDEAVLKAYALGIAGGTDKDTFSPNQPVNREQIALMLNNTLQTAGLADKLQPGGASNYIDYSSISGWAALAVTRLSAAGIMQGTESKEGIQFRPKANVSREQLYTLAYRIVDQYGPVIITSEYDLLSNAGERNKTLLIKDGRTKRMYEEANRIIAEIITPEMSDMEKELAIHDYIVLHTAYDYDNYLNDTIPNDSYSAYGVLFNGTAVCQGYAMATQLLLELAGIETQIVSGTANGGGHAWNKVKLDGEYYNLDVTWDDPVPDTAGEISYSYFNITDKELSEDHKWETAGWPAATATRYDYYEYNGLVLRSYEELKARIQTAAAARETTLSFKATYDGDVRSDLLELLSAARCGFSYSYSNDRSFTVTLRYS